MDVRCEKCQTEYELDEARLKPSGVTVKCTNCGHMFKIRKRSNTNVGAAPPADRTKPATTKPPAVSGALRSDAAVFTDDTVVNNPKADERQWLIRLENGEQKSCRELAILQQWIVAGIVTRESLISRTGKTWKRLGDIGELVQFFSVGDETRAHRTTKPTGNERERQLASAAAAKPATGAATIVGFSGAAAGAGPTSAGGTILADDDESENLDDELDARRTGEHAAPRGQHTPRPQSMPPPPPATRTPALGSSTTKAPPMPPPRATPPTASATIASLSPPAPAQLAPTSPPTPPPGRPTPPAGAPSLAHSPTEVPGTHTAPPQPPARRPITQPPPPPVKRSEPTPSPIAPTILGDKPPALAAAAGNRATAMWATDGIKPKEGGEGKGPSGPRSGKLSAIPDEPAFAGSFAGRVRTEPTDASVFGTGKQSKIKGAFDDDDDALPARRGSRAGTWIALLAVVVIAGSAAAIYAMMRHPDHETAGTKPLDAAVVATATVDAGGTTVTPIAPDNGSNGSAGSGSAVAPAAAFAAQRGELVADVEGRLLPALAALAAQDDPPALAMRAHVGAAIAQDLRDRAGLVDKAEGDKLRTAADKLTVESAQLAQRAQKAAPDDPTANLAMAEVLRLQKKSPRDIKRYADTARGKLDAKADPQLAREIALADALVLARDSKLADARAAFAAIDAGDNKLESSGDVRARFHLALALVALGKPADAKALVDQILAAQPEHAGARALASKLATTVATADPLPPEEHRDAGVASPPPAGKDAAVAVVDPGPGPGPGPVVPAGDYGKLVQQANKLAETNCTEAMKLFQRALDQNPAGADALTGIGYCQLDAKQFSSAYSKFSAALAVDPHHEGALAGIAEMYQQQGKKDKAIEAWKNYQAVYPGSAKAQRQLDRLGGAPTPPTPGSDVPQTPPAPTPTPTPTPAPPEPGSDGT